MKYIYGLIDPDDRSIRYVGQTNNLSRRHIEHAERDESTPKGRWIAQLRVQGKQPDIVCLEVVPKDADPSVCEKWWLTLIEDHFFELTNGKNPSRKPVSFGDMFSERLQREYDVFMAAMKSQEPLVMITRAQFGVFVTFLKLFGALLVGSVIGAGAWHFEYGLRENMVSAIWLGTSMGLASASMLCVVLTKKFKHAWFVYVYCGFYFLVGLSRYWG